MFPESGPLLELLLKDDKNVNEIIEICLSKGTTAYLLNKLSTTVINIDEEVLLEVNRNCLWNRAKCFYKKATTADLQLKKNLIISFSGEDGVDAGALRNEFFVSALKQMNSEFFEGKEDRRLPRCHWGCETEQLIAGVLVGHSLLFVGPGFPCLHPAVYNIIFDSSDHYQPIIQDIPVNLATADVLEMITQVYLYTVVWFYFG